jgi:hypothetical protein
LLVATKGEAPIRPTKKKKKKPFSFLGDEFSFSDYYLKTYFKKERNEREIEKEKEEECKKKKGRTGTVGLLSKRRLPSPMKERAGEGYQLKRGVGRCGVEALQRCSVAGLRRCSSNIKLAI